MNFLAVAIGGAIGAVLRYGLTFGVGFPFGTLCVNLLGALLIGFAYGLYGTRISASSLFVMVGILGGFTTFSAFSLDVLKLYEAGRIAAAGGYVFGTVLGSLLAAALGLSIMRSFLT